MKFIDEYRDRDAVKQLTRAIHSTVTKDWKIMEVCGGQTHAIVKFGIDRLLPERIRLIHGPGCPVCVTPLELIDKAQRLADNSNVILCTFGDMLRVPGSNTDLFAVKAGGGDVRVVYSPLDALALARSNPKREVVFFAVGFETTAPTTAATVFRAAKEGIDNFSLLVSHVLVPPAIEAILSSPSNQVDGFLAAGHVCTIMGYEDYEPIAKRFCTPIVVTGFEPLDILEGVYLCIKQLESGTARVENQYCRAVRQAGNPKAQQMLREVFEPCGRKWRGIGELPQSGLRFRKDYAQFDAERRFSLADLVVEEPSECESGKVLQGLISPAECAMFGTTCTPHRPLGAPMVSSEGACAAYYRFRRMERDSETRAE